MWWSCIRSWGYSCIFEIFNDSVDVDISMSVHWYVDKSDGDRFCRGNIYGVESNDYSRVGSDDGI